MWRKCDLHNHTTPNEQDNRPLEPDVLVAECVAQGLDLIAITDHDSTGQVEQVREAAEGTALMVVAGLEISTDRGHILVIAPDQSQGLDVLTELSARLGLGSIPEQTSFSELVDVVRRGKRATGERFRDTVVLVGSHVDQDGSILGARQSLAVAEQVRLASELDALEVVSDQTLQQWEASGVKGTGISVPLLKGSDSHISGGRVARSTWLYLPRIDHESFSHALATPESSISLDSPGASPQMVIEKVSFVGGLHDGLSFHFSERTNAIIGPPLSGKSLIVDALRFAFGQTCPVEEIAKVCSSRLERRLGQGSRVIVEGRGPGGQFVIDRVWGGAQEMPVPFSPIIFSQTELVRRGIEEHPSMALVDVQAPLTAELKQELSDLSDEVGGSLHRLAELADRARDLAARVDNSEDGLLAVQSRIKELSGTETFAQKANDLSRLRGWRERTKARASEWLATFETPEAPVFSSPPDLSDQVDAVDYVPLRAMEEAAAAYREKVERAARGLRETIDSLIDHGEAALVSQEEATSRALEQRGFELGEAVLNELQALRDNLTDLEEANAALTRTRSEIDSELETAKEFIAKVEQARSSLRVERKRILADINSSMPDFFARLEEDFYSQRLDALIDDAKVGTGRWRRTLEEVRGGMDRVRLIEVAVRSSERRAGQVAAAPALETQDQIAVEAMNRRKIRQLTDIATLWPGDGLVLTERASGDPFEQLTEGMRSLAIKEMSFAANRLPVISDQPEDAVPPEAVYGKLVSTLRNQRAERQFIFASHDANLVVAGDVERIVVLRSAGQPEEGTLFQSAIRESAIQLLEGGPDAFALRGKRYRTGE